MILISFLSFLSKLAMLIQVQIEKEQDPVHIFQYIYFENSQIHLQAVMYQFEHIDHDIHQGFFVFNSSNTFLACI